MDGVTSNKEFLQSIALFRNLDDNALSQLAAISIEYEYDQGAVIAYQRDVANSLYIVKEGRLFARSLDRSGVARETHSYLPGQYFNDTWLFVPSTHPSTVKGAEAGRLLIISGADFLNFLELNPRVVKQLAPGIDEEGHPVGLSAAAWEEARKKLRAGPARRGPDVGLLPDELLEYFSRRSVWFLAINLTLPIILTLAAPILFLVWPPGVGLANVARYAVPGLMFIVGLLWTLLRWIDWRNDYFAITSKHVLHREFELRHFRINLVKVPVGMIQSVETVKPSLLANLFDIGTVRITTAAQTGVVLFDNIDDPVEVKDILEQLSRRVRSLDAAQAQQMMRESVEQHFEMDPFLRSVAEEEPQAVATPPSVERRSLWAGLQQRFGWRVAVGNTITYRKSIFVLLRYIAWPTLGFVVITALGLLLINIGFTGQLLVIVLAVLFVANLIWFIWDFENWRNDIFQLTDRFVIDIDRLPFGFGESRKQAPLSNIQNVNAIRPGFLATLFNYGNVTIDTAGVSSDIVFENVINPSQIQSDIFGRLDEVRRQQRIREGNERRREYAVLLDVYRQELEEQRIPRRLPQIPDEEFSDEPG